MNEVIRATVALRTPAIRATHEPRWATGRDRVLIVEGSHNAAFDQIRANLPYASASRAPWNTSLWMLMRSCQDRGRRNRYDGSLTTPPCSEGVKWFVMTTPIALSTAQIGVFTPRSTVTIVPCNH
jgi:carbonic anhydrase